MLLRPDYRYLFLDFETTGLDTIKDDPIQIGMLLMDHEGKIVDTFSSPLRPQKPINELKSIVTYLTQTSLDELAHAPCMDDIKDQVKPFFMENTVLIWHNIGFDLSFLKRYYERTPLFTIDTFPLCKSCLHFLPSYALEVIANHLGIASERAHDALADCVMNKEVFLHCIRHLQKIRDTYMIFDYILQNSQTPLASIIARTVKRYDFGDKTLFLPPLVKPSQATKKIVTSSTERIKQEQLWKASQYYIWNHTIGSLLAQIQREKSSRILCFSHKSKLDLADHYLTIQWVSTWLINDASIFLPERIDQLLRKWLFDEAEVAFLAKYLSHHLQTHTIIDVNSSDDYKIFNALTEQKPPRLGQVILATHEQLYTHPHPIDPETHVLFFDVDRRWQTRSKHHSQPLDPHHLLQYLEHIAYKALLLQDQLLVQESSRLATELHLFFGILWWEIDHLFVWHAGQTIDIEDITTHTRLPKSKAALEKLLSHTSVSNNHDELTSRRKKEQERIQTLFGGPLTITKNMYQGDKRWYTFASPQSFSTFLEMKEQLPKATYSFLSTLNTQATALWTVQPWWISLPLNDQIRRPEQLITFLENTTENIFVLSTSKSHSQDLFQQLVRAKKDAERLIVGENITWWVGKIIYLATQSKKPVLMIWWFGCYLAARAKKFAISSIITYYCEGKQKPLLLADMQFYRPYSSL